MSRRTLATGIAAAVAAGSLALTTPAASGDEPAPLPSSPLSLQGPERMVTESWRGQVWTDFGLRLVAGDEPVAIWSTRPSYDDPITSVWRTSGGDVPLPADAMPTFSGLSSFAQVSVANRDGKVIRRFDAPACLNGYDVQRVHPSAPAESPYPHGCPWNPYTLGSVMGIQTGWSSPLLNEWSMSMRLKPGRYDVTGTILPAWVDFFGIAPEEATSTTRLVVRRAKDGRQARPERPAARSGPVARPAAHEPESRSAGTVVPATAPNLKSLPAFHIGLNRKGTQLRFGANVWNGGGGPLVVDGFRPADGHGHDHHMVAYQYFFDGEGNQTGYEQIGRFHWHGANHQHWHFEDFAGYRLLDSDMNLAVRSRKASFCLANTDAVDYTIPDADWQPGNTDLGSACGGRDALSLRQVLSNGSGDTYHQYRAGQAFGIKNLPDGVYYIEVVANPNGIIVESDETDNVSLRKVRIGTGRKGKRFVRVPRVGVIDEHSGW
ncbi:lysyl oxidase family protein [Nocardioides coralli]|uniref:lysyl oxidase family protein n=1 Tax=Nocardioides coralli TaxID=2872154 RepID=UPI001CA38C4F|nr:lysyl oxidase family protein [Nocardioides coralli]QZY30238.1 hypothetical protein K6T13_06070 [Nocardioides coralli]